MHLTLFPVDSFKPIFDVPAAYTAQPHLNYLPVKFFTTSYTTTASQHVWCDVDVEMCESTRFNLDDDVLTLIAAALVFSGLEHFHLGSLHIVQSRSMLGLRSYAYAYHLTDVS